MILTDANLLHWVMFYDEGWRFGRVRELKGTRARIEHPKGTKEWVDFKNIEGLGDDFDPFSGKLIRPRVQASVDNVAENNSKPARNRNLRTMHRVRGEDRIQLGDVGEKPCVDGCEDSGSSLNSGILDIAPSTGSNVSTTTVTTTLSALSVRRTGCLNIPDSSEKRQSAPRGSLRNSRAKARKTKCGSEPVRIANGN